MSKKTIILCVALILALTLGLGGTLAYLTDTDADKNVMTVGRVQVVQNEQQRVEDENDIFTDELEQFENDKMLLPVTDRDNTPDTVTVGEWEVTMDDDLNNYIDKIISATNTGNTDAWVRTLVAVPTGAETDDPEEYWNKIESASDNWLHWNAMPDPEEGEQWSWPAEELGLITVDDVVYAVFAFTHHEKVAPGETTYPVVRGLYMDERVDMDVVKDEEGKLVDQYYMMVNGKKQVIYDVPDKNGKVNMLVLTQAVQADGFATADEAFDKAFALGEDEKATLFNWFGGEDGWDDEIGSPGDKNDTNNPPLFTDHWDGEVDTSWYNETDTEFVLETAAQLAGLRKLVDEGNTFAGKTIKLGTNMCLGKGCSHENHVLIEGETMSFDPIGYGYNVVFKGTFDGQGKAIQNLYQNGWALGLSYGTQGGGLFASVVDATIKNLTIDNAEIVMECVDMGTLVGYSYGNCTYENITVKNSTIGNYQRYTGGVVGEVNGTQTFKNVDMVGGAVHSLWGDFDASLGGIIGGKYGDADITMEDCDVSCRIDAFNDVISSYQWYAYRRAGMLIGNTEETATTDGRTVATASFLTAKNCTVTYDYDKPWTNYTYCEFAGTSWPYVRVQDGYATDAYSNPRYGHPVDANGKEVVDDNHVHNEGEDHFVLCEFDQLYGGGQGVYGTATHDGVKVIYN